MDYQTKAATQSLSIMAQLVAIIGMTLKMFGVDMSEGLADLPQNTANLVDAVMILSAQVVALYGRFRADKRITGIFKAS